jgi:2-hydroxy-3-keto-5-methylthiopentenyl-1-phosphate phosphatase
MNPAKHYNTIVFCDFDGTITAEETFVGMLQEFSTVDYNRTEQLLLQGEISLRDAVRRQVESIPSKKYPQVQAYIRDKALRAGFVELLDYLHFQGIPLVVVSGGLLQSVQSRLEPHRHRIHAVHAAEIDCRGTYLRIFSDYESDSEMVAKTEVMAQYPCRQSIVIGDGITDVNPALTADLAFARDRLCRYLADRGKAFVRWEDFYDIIARLQKRWLVEPSSGF